MHIYMSNQNMWYIAHKHRSAYKSKLCSPTPHHTGMEPTVARGRTGRIPPKNCFAPLEKCVGHSLKLLDIVSKIWAPLRTLFASPSVPSWLRAWWSQVFSFGRPLGHKKRAFSYFHTFKNSPYETSLLAFANVFVLDSWIAFWRRKNFAGSINCTPTIISSLARSCIDCLPERHTRLTWSLFFRPSLLSTPPILSTSLFFSPVIFTKRACMPSVLS